MFARALLAMIGICYLVCAYAQQRAREKREKREHAQEPEGIPLLVRHRQSTRDSSES